MTSSVQPPVLNPSLGTPSSEWAKDTTSSFDPTAQVTPHNVTSEQVVSQSPGVTPGNEFPGAFPNRGQGETSTDTTNITETIVDTAKQYFNKVGTFLGNPLSLIHIRLASHTAIHSGNNNSSGTSETDKGVRASEHDIYHKASLPSEELRGALPHERVGGVGSLPGASIEKSVALLPDEEADWSQWKSFAGRNTPGYQTPSNRQSISSHFQLLLNSIPLVKENATGPSQTVTQKATNLGVAAGVVKPDVPPKSETVEKGYPETITSREIANAQQAVSNIEPGMTACVLSSHTL